VKSVSWSVLSERTSHGTGTYHVAHGTDRLNP
jgi:hypothetical protein